MLSATFVALFVAALIVLFVLRVIEVLLLVFIAGHAADRYDRQRVVQACQLIQALVAAFLCWGSWQGWLTIPAIYAAVAFLGMATAFESPATAALLTGVAPKGQFQRAAALNTGLFQVAVISGPALGGFAYAAGPEVPYAIMTAFWLARVAISAARLRSEITSARSIATS